MGLRRRPLMFPSTAILDDFNRADGPVGANWTQAYTGSGFSLDVLSNQMEGAAGGATQFSGAYWNVTGELLGGVEVAMDVPTLPTTEWDLMWRTMNAARSGAPASSSSTDWSGYQIVILSAGTFEVFKYDGTTNTSISGAPVAATVAAGDTWGVQMVGSTIQVYRRASGGAWTLLATYTDATYATGWIGAAPQGFVGRYDNFQGGNTEGPDVGGTGPTWTASIFSNRTAPSRRVKSSLLRRPVVIRLLPFAPSRVYLTRSRLVTNPSRWVDSHLKPPPPVVGAGMAFSGPRIIRTRSRLVTNNPSRWVDSHLKPPIVVGAGISFSGPRVIRTQSRLLTEPTRHAVQYLRPPAGGAGISFSGPLVVRTRSRLVSNPSRWVDSHLKPPAVVAVIAVEPLAPPIRVTLVDRNDDASILANQQRPLSRLRGPLYIIEPVLPNLSFGGPGVRLAPQSSGKPKSKLYPPTVVSAAAAPFVARSLLVHLSPSSRGKPKPKLSPPVVVTAAVVAVYSGPRVAALAKIRPPRTISRLELTAIIDLRPQVYFIEAKVVRIRPVPVRSIIRKPTDLVDQQDVGRTRITLAPQKRGAPKSELRPPVVIDLRPQAYYLSVTLVRITPPPTITRLAPPTDLVDAQDRGSVAITLAPSFRGRPRSRLLPVPAAFQPVGFVTVTLAYSLRGKPKSILRGPVVIDLSPQVYTVATTLVRIRPVPTRWAIRKPTDLIDAADLGSVAVTLAPQKRGIPKSRLSLTAIIDLRPQTYFVAVTLAPQSRGIPKSRLEPPTVTAAVVALAYPIAITLAPSSRGIPKSILRRPVVIDLTPQVYYPAVTLAPSFRGKPKPILGTPTDLVDTQDLGFVAVTLAYSSRGKPKSRLIPPTVVAPVLANPTVVQLAASFRGTPKSRLEPPTVVFPFFARPTDITLVRIRPVPTLHVVRRPVDLVDRDDLGFIGVHLAYQSRGKPKSILRSPTVIDLRPQTYYVSLTLAPSRFPKPKSILRPDSKFAPQPQADYTILVKLAPQTRGTPKSKLRPPAVVGAGIFFREILVRLAPSRFPKPKSRLLPVPAAFQPVGFVTVTLAPSRFPRPLSVLRKPVVVQEFRIPVVRVHLAPSRFPKPISRLKPPTVVSEFVARPTRVVLAPQRRGIPRSFLKPPTVVGAGRAFYGPQITLVRIRPVRTIHFFQTGVVAAICYGTVVGFDFAPEVCGSDEGAIVTGSDSGATVSGSDSGATVTGATAAGGSVTGGDTKREGC